MSLTDTSRHSDPPIPLVHTDSEGLRSQRRRKHKSRIPRSGSDLYKSFENLVVLSNYQEVRKVGKKLVWRDKGEPPVLLESLRDCAEHAGTGALRAGILAFTARSGVNIFLLLFTLARTSKKFRARLVLHALFGSDSFRFAAMLGSFVAIYKYILNGLPIIALRIEESKMHQQQLPNETLDDEDKEIDHYQDSAASSYPNSDVEFGLSMKRRDGSLSRAKPKTNPRLKGIMSLTPITIDTKPPSPGPVETSTEPSTTSTSPIHTPTTSRMPRRAHFAEHVDTQIYDAGSMPNAHLSTSTQTAAKLYEEKGYVYKRWHAALAGFVAGGVAVLMEKKGRRLGISQQMFVRGLQGSFNLWSARTGITVPFGSVLVFSLCCGQIMYGYLLRPDTIPRSYNTWIQKASVVPEDAVDMNRELVQQGTLNLDRLERLATGKGIPWNGKGSIVTKEAGRQMLEHLERAKRGDYGPRMMSCAGIHPHFDSCTTTGLMRIWEVGKWMAPVYGALHFIPMLLFKRKIFMKDPLRMMVKALLGTIRSSTFLGAFVAIYQSYICLLHFLHDLPLPSGVSMTFRKFLLSKPMWWLGGILSGLSLFVEERRRREELAMYVLPKGLESGWKLFRGEIFGVPTKRKRGWKSDAALCAAGMGMVMSTYQYDPHHLSGLVRRLLYQFVGPN
ncbi:hypothetical protein FRC03_010200 [Tulasnella sp. 419]|nr:hypothetical protein FRC03_010200 [Tulasnella sp. 419]